MGRNMRIAAFPIIVGFLTGFGLYLMKIPDLVMPRLEFLLNAIISCATTVSGFIISSVAILIGATESQIMIKIKKWRFPRVENTVYRNAGSRLICCGLFRVFRGCS